MSTVSLFDDRDGVCPTVKGLGLEGFELLHLPRHGLETVPTLLIGVGAFEQYRKDHILDDAVAARVLEFATNNRANEVTIRPSTAQKLIGLVGLTEVQADVSRIRFAIERIYRSWHDDRATAYRMTHAIDEEECLPAIILQVIGRSVVHVLSTRNPRNGRETDAETFRHNVNNRIDAFGDEHRALLRAVELVTRRPTAVYFQSQPTLKIMRLEEQSISRSAMLMCARSMYEMDILDEAAVLHMLHPDMLGGAFGAPFLNPDLPPTARGLPASEGIAMGRVIWPRSEDAVIDSRILIADDWHPDYNDVLVDCIGAIAASAAGGLISHLAVQARGRSIPAVIGVDNLRLDFENSRILVGNLRFTPDCYAIVEGDTGRIWLSDERPRLSLRSARRCVAADGVLPHLDWVDSIAQSLLDGGRFKESSVSFQHHVAGLRSMIAKLKAGHD